MSFVCSYGYIEPVFVLMEVISVSNDWIWLSDEIKQRAVNSAPWQHVEILSNGMMNLIFVVLPYFSFIMITIIIS